MSTSLFSYELTEDDFHPMESRTVIFTSNNLQRNDMCFVEVTKFCKTLTKKTQYFTIQTNDFNINLLPCRHLPVKSSVSVIFQFFENFKYFEKLNNFIGVTACIQSAKQVLDDTVLCVNFSSLSYGLMNNVLLLTQNLKLSFNKGHFNYQTNPCDEISLLEEKFSWNDALDLCFSANATLPMLFSTEEQTELLALMRFKTNIPPIEALWIGLHQKKMVSIITGDIHLCGRDDSGVITKLFLLQGQLSWTNNVPVAFTAFNNIYFDKSCHNCFPGINFKHIDDYKPEYFCSSLCCVVGHTCPNLTSLKIVASSTIYPFATTSDTCTLMLVSNLAEPEWISTSCNQKLLNYVFCTQTTAHHQPNKSEDGSQSGNHSLDRKLPRRCFSYELFFHENCLHFLFVSTVEKNFQAIFAATFGDFEKIKLIFHSVGTTFPAVFVTNNSGSVSVLFCKTRVWIFSCTHNMLVSPANPGFLVMKRSAESIILGGNIFRCADRSHISTFFRCDGDRDCPADDSDEKGCIFYSSPKPLFELQSQHQQQNVHDCESLYYKTATGHCVKYGWLKIANNNHSEDKRNDMQHSDNDLFVDEISKQAQEEHDLIALLVTGTEFKCSLPAQLQCREGHSKCFFIADICVFVLNSFGILKPCRNGGHMQNCTFFECGNKFKCPRSYCIPWRYVCDNKWDCPLGDDEMEKMCTRNHMCPNMFKCSDMAHTCVHLSDMCDGHEDCVFKDDEQLCQLKNTVCPPLCTCLMFAMVCHGSHMTGNRLPFWFISLRSVTMLLTWDYLLKSPNARYVDLKFNSLKSCCMVPWPQQLSSIDLRYNEIHTLTEQCIGPHPALKVILLANNCIKYIEEHAFVNVSSFMVLSLSNNQFHTLSGDSFPSFSSKLLVVQNVDFQSLDNYLFKMGSPACIVATDFQICCAHVVNSYCAAKKPWYRSCDQLLPNKYFQSLYFLVPVVIFGLCIASVTCCVKSSIFQKAFCFTTAGVNSSDCILVFYFMTVSASDFVMQDSFSTQYKLWSSSTNYFVAFGTVMWFSYLNNLLFTFLSISRLMVVMHPVTTRCKRLHFVCSVCLSLYSGTFIAALLCTTLFTFLSKHVPLSLCLPFVDPTASLVIINTFAWCLAILQLSSSMFIAVSHILLIQNLRKAQDDIKKCSTKEYSNTLLIIQLFLVTASVVLCWIPNNIVYLAVMCYDSYPIELITWTTICLLPINSVAQPIIFMTFALKAQLQK